MWYLNSFYVFNFKTDRAIARVIVIQMRVFIGGGNSLPSGDTLAHLYYIKKYEANLHNNVYSIIIFYNNTITIC